MTRKLHVFLCHASQDKPAVRKLGLDPHSSKKLKLDKQAVITESYLPLFEKVCRAQ